MTIQIDDAKKLREQWNGSDCPHDKLEKEYYLGSATGDFVCSVCGETGPGRNWSKRDNVKPTDVD